MRYVDFTCTAESLVKRLSKSEPKQRVNIARAVLQEAFREGLEHAALRIQVECEFGARRIRELL